MPAANALSACWACRKRGFLMLRPVAMHLEHRTVERRVRIHGDCYAGIRRFEDRREYWRGALWRLRRVLPVYRP